MLEGVLGSERARAAAICFDQATSRKRRIGLSMCPLKRSDERRLTPLLDRFTEGLGTTDLIAAKQLLDALGNAGRK